MNLFFLSNNSIIAFRKNSTSIISKQGYGGGSAVKWAVMPRSISWCKGFVVKAMSSCYGPCEQKT